MASVTHALLQRSDSLGGIQTPHCAREPKAWATPGEEPTAGQTQAVLEASCAHVHVCVCA